MHYIVVTTPHELKSMITEVINDQLLSKSNLAISIPKNLESPRKYLSRAETSEQLGITLPTLAKYTKQGIIKSHRIGNRVLYKIEDIENAVINRKF